MSTQIKDGLWVGQSRKTSDGKWLRTRGEVIYLTGEECAKLAEELLKDTQSRVVHEDWKCARQAVVGSACGDIVKPQEPKRQDDVPPFGTGKSRGQITLGNTTYDVTEDYHGVTAEPTYTLHGPKSDFILRGFTNRENLYAVISWPNGHEKRIAGNRVLVRFNEDGHLEVVE